MLKIVNNKIYIVRGDDEAIQLAIRYGDAARTPYEMQPEDVLTLTVRQLPLQSSPVLLQVRGEAGSNRIELRHEDTATLEYGAYSADLQLTRGDGRRMTVWPTQMGSDRIKGRNLKNFYVAAEVTME
ncbi:MAG: hypothetical protein IJ466_00370 [Clostridia bacterium]|nr:hypothetical protein [Clostridia bacterium]